MNYTAVVVTYNRLSLLQECLSCIENQELAFSHVVIVDNASTDGTREYLKSLNGKYHILLEETNGGGAKGFSDGIQYVHEHLDTDWILVIDDDAMLEPNYISTIDRQAALFPDCLAFSGTVMTDGKIQTEHRRRISSRPAYSGIPVSESDYNLPYFEYQLSTFCGLCFSASLVQEIGIPRADYFIWFDDSEYSYRICQKSIIQNINSISLNHKTLLGRTKKLVVWKNYYGVRNSGDTVRRYGTFIQYAYFHFSTVKSIFTNCFLYLCTRNPERKYASKLFTDALLDMHRKKFGFNPKYGPQT